MAEAFVDLVRSSGGLTQVDDGPLMQRIIPPPGSALLAGLTTPIIYAMIVPTLVLDLCVCIYQAVCFRAWGIVRVRRSDYIAIDRHRLPYLSALQKAHCVYCGYVTGVYAFASEVAARTEQYWCPIKHEVKMAGRHRRYEGFAPYGDARAFRALARRLREDLRSPARER